MRILLPIALLGLTSVALADRLITIPTGSKIKLNTLKAEGQWEQSRNRSERYYLGTGITNAIDAELTGERFDDRGFRSSLNVAFNYIPPILGYGPGVSFGIQDVLGVTRDGRRYYLAITTKEGDGDSVSGLVPLEYTVGLYFGSVTSPFIGVAIPLTDFVKILAEHNGRRINAGVELRPTPDIGLRAIYERRDILIGAQVSIRF